MFSRLLVCSLLLVCVMEVMVSGVLVGEPSEMAPDSCEVFHAAMFAAEIYNSDYSREMTAYKVTTILSARTQVVSGISYILDLQLGLTPCRKSSPSWIFRSCPLHANPKPLLCNFVVTDVPWEHKTTLRVKCNRLATKF